MKKKESKEQRNGEVKCVVDFFCDFLNLQVLFFNKTTNRA